ncbi:hypothetical protein BS47DRAFT_1346131, partial [Hydnum rufescens UP504]
MSDNYDGALNVTATEESELAGDVLRELESWAHVAGKGANGEFCHLLLSHQGLKGSIPRP